MLELWRIKSINKGYCFEVDLEGEPTIYLTCTQFLFESVPSFTQQ
jgi:hypothetical protein